MFPTLTMLQSLFEGIFPPEIIAMINDYCGYMHTTNTGSKCWYIYHNGKILLHRFDEPAVIHSNGGIEYWEYGVRHRAHLPAIVSQTAWVWIENGVVIDVKTRGKRRYQVRPHCVPRKDAKHILKQLDPDERDRERYRFNRACEFWRTVLVNFHI